MSDPKDELAELADRFWLKGEIDREQAVEFAVLAREYFQKQIEELQDCWSGESWRYDPDIHGHGKGSCCTAHKYKYQLREAEARIAELTKALEEIAGRSINTPYDERFEIYKITRSALGKDKEPEAVVMVPLDESPVEEF